MWNGRPTWRPYAAACVDATGINLYVCMIGAKRPH